jgi:hypothetical protein
LALAFMRPSPPASVGVFCDLSTEPASPAAFSTTRSLLSNRSTLCSLCSPLPSPGATALHSLLRSHIPCRRLCSNDNSPRLTNTIISRHDFHNTGLYLTGSWCLRVNFSTPHVDNVIHKSTTQCVFPRCPLLLPTCCVACAHMIPHLVQPCLVARCTNSTRFPHR